MLFTECVVSGSKRRSPETSCHYIFPRQNFRQPADSVKAVNRSHRDGSFHNSAHLSVVWTAPSQGNLRPAPHCLAMRPR